MASVTVGSPFQVKSPLLKSKSPSAGNKFQVQSPLLKKSTPASPAAPAAAGAAAGGCANGNCSQAPPKVSDWMIRLLMYRNLVSPRMRETL